MRSPAAQRTMFASKISTVRQIVAPVAPVEIGRQIRHPRLSPVAQHQGGNAGLRLPHPGSFGWINWKRRDEGQRHNRVRFDADVVEHAAERQDIRFLEALQHRVPLSRRSRFQPQIRVQRSIRGLTPAVLRRGMRSEQIGQREIRTRVSPLVIPAARAGGDQSRRRARRRASRMLALCSFRSAARPCWVAPARPTRPHPCRYSPRGRECTGCAP